MKTLHKPPSSADPLTLSPARVHEAEGQGRSSFAIFQALRHPGPVFWVLPRHEPHRPLPLGLPPGLAERLHLVETRNKTDLLWAIEETLRSPASGFVIGEPDKALSLTAGRRLQLAAEAGRTTGLLLIREGHGCNAAETRWQCEPVAGPTDSTRHRWSRIKNKSGTLGIWTVHWDGASAACDMVSEAGE